MSPVPARRLATAGTLTLALALGSPAAAVAAPAQDERRSDGRNDTAQERRADDRSRPASSSTTGSENRRSSDPGGRPEREAARGSATRADDGGRSSGGRSSGDPRGNNGTVKIDGMAFDDGHGNEPHVGCVFQVDFYGFDAGDTASITFTGQAPTGGGLLHSETATPISDDAAGGGQDRDATLTYSVDEQLAELLAVAPHPQQGWHVRLDVDVDGAPGGAKSKVFWIDCPQPAAVGDVTEAPAAGGEQAAADEQAPGTTLTAAGTPVATFDDDTRVVAQTTGIAGTTLAAAEQQDRLALGAAQATLTAGERVSAQGAVRPRALPLTGLQALLALLTLGLGALGAGAAAHRLGGRRSADERG